MQAAQELLKERTTVKPKKEKVEKEEEEVRKRTRSVWKIKKTRLRKIRGVEKEAEEERTVDVAPDLIRRKVKKPRARKVLGKTCAKQVVCKPEVCCADLEGETTLSTSLKNVPFFPLFFPYSTRVFSRIVLGKRKIALCKFILARRSDYIEWRKFVFQLERESDWNRNGLATKSEQGLINRRSFEAFVFPRLIEISEKAVTIPQKEKKSRRV